VLIEQKPANQMLSETLSDKIELVKKHFLMTEYAIFKTETRLIKRVIARAFLYLFITGISPFLIDSSAAKASNMPDANGVASAELKASVPLDTRAGERRSVAESNGIAGRQLEPLMLFLLGTMLLSIGAAIKLAGTRNHK
jgi:hypothetical protein